MLLLYFKYIELSEDLKAFASRILLASYYLLVKDYLSMWGPFSIMI